MKKIYAIAAMLLVVALMPANQANAQRKIHFGFEVMGGIPLGDYGKFTTFDNYAAIWHENAQGKTPTEAAAAFSFGLNFRVSYDITYQFSAFGTIGFINSFVKNAVTDSAETFLDRYGSAYSFDNLNIFNIPIMFGGRYNIYLANNFGFFGEAGIGINFRQLGDITIVETRTVYDVETGRYYSSMEEKNTPKTGVGFAFQIGAGLQLGKTMSLGIYYLNLGTGDVKYDQTQTLYGTYDNLVRNREVTAGKITQQMLAIRLGFMF